jgi:hypothetical protein
VLPGELAQGFVGLGQAGEAQERQRRLALVFGLARDIDLDLAAGADEDGCMGLIHGQHVQDVAVRVELGAHRARQLELPVEHALALAVVRGQAQVLDARAHLVFVVIGGVVADGQSHTTSR